MELSMLLFSFSFLIGISQLLWLPIVTLHWLIYTVPFYIFALVYTENNSKLIKVILGLILGFSYGIFSAYTAKSTQLNYIPDKTFEVVGKIDSIPIVSDLGVRGNKTKFKFKIDSNNLELPITYTLTNWYNTHDEIKIGQTWKLTLKLKPIHGFKNPGSFDYSKWLFRHGYDAIATVKAGNLIPQETTLIWYWIEQKRVEISQLIDESIESSRVRSLIQALSIGDKSRISYQDSQLFQETGTSHIIAISGLHIGLIAYVGILFGRLFFILFTTEKINRLKYEAVFAIVFSLFYALLAGLSIPTIRALVMVVVFSIAHSCKFKITRWTSWSIALLIVLISDPFSVLDIGFWFSFSAVAVLMFSFSGRKNNQSIIISFIKAQIIILIGLMPLMVIVFHKINLLTPISNLIVLPLASLLLIPLMFASFIVNLFSVNISKSLFNLVEWLGESIFYILDYLQQFKFLSVSISHINSISLVLLILAMALILLPKLFRWKILSILIFVAVLLKSPNEWHDKDFNVSILDVGQGLSVVVQTKNHILVYDTGSKFASGFSIMNSVVLPFMQKRGMDKVDTLILSHGDNDHAGGVDDLLKIYPNIKVLDVIGKYSNCQFPSKWIWDGVLFEILSPFETVPYLGNNSSCVLKVSSDFGSLLLTGDIGEAVEYRLTHNLSKKIQSDVLIIPHHGSKTSSSTDFIKLVNPDMAINSSGFANQFNHPHPDIKERYQNLYVDFFDTQNNGMIEIIFTRDGIQRNLYSEMHPNFWDAKLVNSDNVPY